MAQPEYTVPYSVRSAAEPNSTPKRVNLGFILIPTARVRNANVTSAPQLAMNRESVRLWGYGAE